LAKKRTKKQAKRRIDRVNIIPDADSPFGQVFPRTARSLAVLNIIEEAAKSGGKILVELDPLDRLEDDGSSRLTQAKRIVTDEDTVIPLTRLADMINDPDVTMSRNGTLTRGAKKAFKTGRQVIRDSKQFSMQGFDLPIKKTRRKSKNDSKLSRAFKEANKKLRTKSGKLRKGKSQSDVAKLAHRLRKRMK
jgi:hypothetical protein